MRLGEHSVKKKPKEGVGRGTSKHENSHQVASELSSLSRLDPLRSINGCRCLPFVVLWPAPTPIRLLCAVLPGFYRVSLVRQLTGLVAVFTHACQPSWRINLVSGNPIRNSETR